MNEEQQKAITHIKGPALVIAGPGTGKTHVLTERISYLLQEQKIAGEKIIAVTFTNKAAQEIRTRISQDQVIIKTFHSLGLEILKLYASYVGYKIPFEIIDEEQKKSLLIETKIATSKTVKSISKKISTYKESVKNTNNQDLITYEKILCERNSFDFDDLVYRSVLLLREHPEICNALQSKYEYLLVDEYQDINHAQYELMRMIFPPPASNIFVVGDPNQSIYGFRGGDVRLVDTFLKDYASAPIYQLLKSYRCSDIILNASNNVISDNENILKGLHQGIRLKIIHHRSDKSEAEFIARTIEKHMGGVTFFSLDSNISEGEVSNEISSFSDFAVLVRTSRQMHVIKKAFHDHNIPYQAVSDRSFFNEEPVKSFIHEFKKLPTENILIKQALEKIIETKEPICDKLLSIAESFGTNREAFLEYVALSSGLDTYEPKLEAVSLMTMHAAKGLEFQCVIVPGCEEGIIPYNLFDNQSIDCEEEKRLLYVAMTRAREYLYLTHAERRFMFGKEYNLARSSFIDRIEKELIKFEQDMLKAKSKKSNEQLTLFDLGKIY